MEDKRMMKINGIIEKTPRLFATIWFVGAAAIPTTLILLYILYFDPGFKLILLMSNAPDEAFLLFWGGSSLISAGIWGFSLGPRLFDKTQTKNRTDALLVGLDISFRSLITLLGIYVMYLFFSVVPDFFKSDECNPLTFWGILLNISFIIVFPVITWPLISLFAIIYFGWIIAPFGMFAGILLYNFANRESQSLDETQSKKSNAKSI